MAETLDEFVKTIASYEGAPSVGAKYWETRDLDIAEVARLVRKDIKESVRTGALPRQKYSVKIGRGGHGYQAIDVTTQCPEDHNARVDGRLRLVYILRQYNYDASHGMYDYSCCRFFGRVKIGDDTCPV